MGSGGHFHPTLKQWFVIGTLSSAGFYSGPLIRHSHTWYAKGMTLTRLCERETAGRKGGKLRPLYFNDNFFLDLKGNK